MKIAFTFLLISVGLVSFIQAQNSLTETLFKNKYSIKLENGELVGKGADLLVKEAKSSQFFLIGESHGIAELPMLTTSLFKQIHSYGYNYFAIETGPITARRIENFAKTSNGFTKFSKKYPFALPFFNLKEEAAMIEEVLKISNKNKPILWGLDQEFAASPHFHIVRLYELAPDSKSKAIVKPYYDQITTEFERIIKTKNPSQAFLSSAKAEDFEKLDSAFANSKNKEALEILSELRLSWEIYQKYFTREGYNSNNLRARLMKRNFMNYYRKALQKEKMPKVIFKFGANHMTRGMNYTEVFDIGNFVSEIADSNGSKSFNLLVHATSGKQNRWFPFIPDESLKQKPVNAKDSGFADMNLFLEIADKKDWTLVDLKPFRNPLHYGKMKNLPKGFKEMVFGFDAVLLIPNVNASNYFDWK